MTTSNECVVKKTNDEPGVLMLNFRQVNQQAIKIFLIVTSLSLTLIGLPVVKQALSSRTHQSQAASDDSGINSVSSNTGSMASGETITISGAYLDNFEWQTIAAGYAHNCGLDTTGKAYCWGSDWSGQLGNGAATGYQAFPLAVDSNLSFSQISAADSHTCAIDTTGKAYCWGSGRDGKLGNGGTDTNQPSPTAVDSNLSFSQISAGSNHTCAIDTTGKAYCWGSDSSGGNITAPDTGQLGDGLPFADQSSPVAVDSPLSFSQISAGYFHTCAIDTTGKAYCWGRDYHGSLGNGTMDVHQPSPVAVNTSLSFSQISAGAGHTCAIDTTGKAYCWGSDTFGSLETGQLGDGGSFASQATPVAINSALSFRTIFAADAHSCAITTTDEAYCWGADWSGQVGDSDDYVDQSSPVAINSTLNFSHITANFDHTYAIDSNGRAWCWGDNWEGTLGAVTTNNTEGTPLKFRMHQVSFNQSLDSPVTAFDVTESSMQAVLPAGINSPTRFTVSDPTGVLASFTPASIMVPATSSVSSPALRGSLNIESPDYVVNLTIDASTYPAINNGDGTWSLLAGIITPDLAPGSYDVVVDVFTPTGDPVSSTTIPNGLVITVSGADPTDNTNDPSSDGSLAPATGYGPKIKLASISNFLIPSLVISLLGAGMLVVNKYRARN